MLLNLIVNGGVFMTNKEAMETVLDAAELYITLMDEKSMDFKHEELDDAIWQMQDYKNDLMRKEN